MQSIHISTARRMLALRELVTVTYVTRKGEVETLVNAMPLRADFYSGTRNFKLPNGEIRKVRDHLIIAINDKEVFL